MNEPLLVTKNTKFWQAVSLVDANGNIINVSLLHSVQEVTQKITISNSGSVAAGKRSVTLICSSNFSGSILGDVCNADEQYTFSASLGNTLNAISYIITTGSLTILTTE